MKMPEAKAWIRGSGLEMLKLENGGVATVFASDGMSNYSQPLYDKQALIDLLEATLSEEIAEHAGRQWWAKTRHTNGPLHLERYASAEIMAEAHETARMVIEAAVKKLKELL